MFDHVLEMRSDHVFEKFENMIFKKLLARL